MESASGNRLIGSRSLTKDALFFLTFIFQVVVLFVFFWQKRQNVRRYFLGENSSQDDEVEEGEENSAVQTHEPSSAPEAPVTTSDNKTAEVEPPVTSSSSTKAKEKSPEEELDAEFLPIEFAIADLKKKIKGLEGTLHRRKGHYATDSLKSRLTECISEISTTLKEMGQIDPSVGSEARVRAGVALTQNLPAKIDIIQREKPALEEKLREFEQIAHRAAPEPVVQIEAPVSVSHQEEEAPKRSDEAERAALVEDAPAVIASDSEDSASSSSEDESDEKSEESSESKKESSQEEAPSKSKQDDSADDDFDADALQAALMAGMKGGKVKGVSFQAPAPASAPVTAPSKAAKEDDDFDADALQAALMAGMKGGKVKGVKATKGGFGAMFDLSGLDDTASPKPVEEAPKSPSAGQKTANDLFALFNAPSSPKQSGESPAKTKQNDSFSDEEAEDTDDLSALLASKMKEQGATKSSSSSASSSAEEESSSEEGSAEDTSKEDLLAKLGGLDLPDESNNNAAKDDLLASLAAFDTPAASNEEGEDSGKNDLLASLNAFSGGAADFDFSKFDDEKSDAESSDAESSSSSSEEESEESKDLLVNFGSHGDINLNGLKRAKKTVQMKGTANSAKSYQMEDEWIAIHPYADSENRALFCVFDGHAGREAASAAKSKFPEIFARLTADADEKTNLSSEFTKAFLDTDQELLEYEYEGTTATAVALWRQKDDGDRLLQAANVGDSSAVVVNGDGVAKVITFDHRPTCKEEVARIREMGIQMNEGQTRLNGLAVSRALGDHFPKSIPCGIVADPFVSEPINVDQDGITHLIVASDGVWDVISAQRAYDLIKDEEDAEKAAQTIVKTVVKSAKCTDNVSCIVVRL